MDKFINEQFTKSFGFPDDFVKAKINKQGDLCLRIGWRDIQVGNDGVLIGSGSDLELMKKYTVIEN